MGKRDLYFAALMLLFPIAPASAAPVVSGGMTCTSSGLSCSALAPAGTLGGFDGSFGYMVDLLHFNFFQDSLEIRNANASSYGVVAPITFSFAEQGVEFTDATVLSSTGFINLSQANFGVTNGAVTFNSTSFSALPGADLILRLGSVGTVPESETWILMIAGVGVIGLLLRKRKCAPAMRRGQRGVGAMLMRD